MADCPSDETLAALLDGSLVPDEVAAVHRHIDGCAPCRTLLADAARSGAPGDAPLPRGAVVGRYVVIGLVGAGAMGVVYAAWDPQLERKVALKLLHPDGGSGAGDGTRLLREAQAMAQLQHPHVIAVHDVGTIGERVFVAMELVDGQTLDAWLRARRRSWREVLAIFADIGEGLAAAHAAGLVHRDFKPDNVLVSADGRARVGDFGLAHATDAAAGSVSPLLTMSLTQTGALVGTPVYMSPEQLAGAPADARSDQFAFCVALFEALFGERPFAGDDPAALKRAIESGAARRPPAGVRVPARVRRILARGLDARPERRHSSMRAIVVELERAERARAMRVTIAVAAALALGVAGAWAWRAAHPACAGAELAWGDVWNPQRRAAVDAAFAASGRPSARFAFAAVDRALAAYGSVWIATHRRICEATRVRGEQPEALLSTRMQCLDDRRREAVALVRVFSAADGPLVDRSMKAVGELGGVEACVQARGGASGPPSDPARAARLDELRSRLAEAKALDDAGRYQQGIGVVQPAIAEARTLGARVLEARLLYRRGHLEKQVGQSTAEATLHDAAIAATAARDDETAADAWTYLSFVAGFDGGRRGEGQRWSRYAAAAIERLGGDDLREARRLSYLIGLIHTDPDRADETRQLLGRERELLLRAGAPETMLLENDVGRGMLALSTGRLDEALAAYRRVREGKERQLGPSNPGLASSIDNEAVALVLLGRGAEAIPLYRRSLELRRGSGNGEAFTRLSLARALRGVHQPAQALDEDRRAVSIYEQATPPPAWIAEALTGEGEDLLLLGRAGEAVRPLERALVVRNGPDADPEDRATTQFDLARALWDGGGGRSRAAALARAARQVFAPIAARFGAFHAASLRDVDAWLKDHSLPPGPT